MDRAIVKKQSPNGEVDEYEFQDTSKELDPSAVSGEIPTDRAFVVSTHRSYVTSRQQYKPTFVTNIPPVYSNPPVFDNSARDFDPTMLDTSDEVLQSISAEK